MSNDSPTPRPPAPAAPFADHDALPPGTLFGEFEIIRVLGVGGFGIVYLAQDHSLERQVALKEYMPASLASRGVGPAVTVRSAAFAETYAIGLRSFVNEARLLARFDHPSLVKVYRFWEDNATAYMVMPYLQGVTLRDARRAMSHAPDEAWIRSVLEPMLDALEQLHREGVFHRDIAPDNILLPPEGAPILLDFGAARRVISDRTQSLTAILKPSYAPIEQYADMTAMRQGPWTDVYALGAVVHYLLFGAPPAPATARAVQNDAVQIEHRIVPGVSPHFMAVVAWMLAVRPLERPQNVASVRGALSGQLALPSAANKQHAGVTMVGDAAAVPLPVPVPGSAAAGGDTRIDPTFQHTLRVESQHTAPSGTETMFQPTAWVPMAGMAPPAAALSLPVPPLPTGGSGPGAPTPAAMAAAGAGSAERSRSANVPSAPTRRGVVLAAVATLAALAAVVLWQFVGVLGGPRAPLAADQAASNASAVAEAPAPSGAGRSVGAGTAPAAGLTVAAQAAPGSALIVTPMAASMGTSAGTSAAIPAATPSSTPSSTPAADVAPALPAPVAIEPVKPNRLADTAKPAGVALGASVPASVPARSKPRPVPAKVNELATTTSNGDAEESSGRGSNTARDATPPSRQAPVATSAAPSSAREACGSRVFIAMALCMERECENPRFRDQPECARLMEIKRNRSGGQ